MAELMMDRCEERECGYVTPCWVWTGPLNNYGYGSFWHADSQRQLATHRFAWEQVNGPIPTGLVTDHLCRVRACCRPDHIEIVTQRENVIRGKVPKLTAEDVAVIRSSDEPARVLAKRYGIGRRYVYQLRREQQRWVGA